MYMQHVLQMSEQLVLERFIKNILNKIILIYCGLRRGPIVTIYTHKQQYCCGSICILLQCRFVITIPAMDVTTKHYLHHQKKYRDYSPMVGVWPLSFKYDLDLAWLEIEPFKMKYAFPVLQLASEMGEDDLFFWLICNIC